MPTPPRQLRHSGAVLAVLAPLVALWLGLTAPDTSPVQPAPAVQQAVDPAAGPDQPVTRRRPARRPPVTAPDLQVRRRSVAWPRPRIAPEELLAAIVMGAIAVAVWPVALALSGPPPLPLTAALAHVTGMLAGYGVVVLLALRARARALERGVGADRLARWHGRGGRIVVTLVLMHAVAAVTAWAGTRGVDPATAAWQVLTMPGLIAATAGTGLLLAVAALSVRAARRRVSYEQWHAVHLLVYAGVALSFTHQLAGPDLAGHWVLQVLWPLLYTGVFALVLQHRVIAPLRNAGRHRMRVTAVVPEGPGVVSLIIAGEHLHELRAEAGQFFRWRFLTPDLWRTAHPFSLSAAPTPSHLRLTVTALGDSSRTLQRLEPGTWVLAEGPYGAITAQRRTRRDVLLVAGGVGITPMRALFETMPLGPGRDLVLIYRARSVDDLLFRAELEAIARNRGARLHYLLGNQIGPFTADLFHRLVPGLPQRDVYLCGPPAMAIAARRALREAGLPAVQLHEERFDS